MGNRNFKRLSLVGLLLGIVMVPSLALSENSAELWTQWRGPNRDGIIQAPAWPEAVSPERLKQAWNVELGPSYSGPIVDRDHVYVTETQNESFEVVKAFDRVSGELVWETRWQGAMSMPFFARANGSWIRATPATDGERLFVAGIRDVLVCLESKTGKILWKIDFVEQMGSPLPSFGFVSSPLLIGDHVFVQAGGGFLKLEKETGKVVWRTLADGGGMYGSAFSSPYYAELQGKEQIIVQTRTALSGVDPQSGQELWKQEIPAFRGMNILTPTVVNDSIFTSSYGGGTFLFNASSTGLEEAWKHKAQGYMSSPVVIDGHVYLHLRNQRFTCIDLTTGREKWTTRPYGKYWSMIANGDKILALDQRGDLMLIQANPEEFTLLGTRKVAEDSWSHVAVSGNTVFIRGLDGLTVYEWK